MKTNERTYVSTYPGGRELQLSAGNRDDCGKTTSQVYLFIYDGAQTKYDSPLMHITLSRTQSEDLVRQAAAILGGKVTFPCEVEEAGKIYGDDFTKR
jgi:hypothetical protein